MVQGLPPQRAHSKGSRRHRTGQPDEAGYALDPLADRTLSRARTRARCEGTPAGRYPPIVGATGHAHAVNEFSVCWFASSISFRHPKEKGRPERAAP
jgi:hypothetical protein